MTKFAHIENNAVTGVYDLLPEAWRNVSNLHASKDDTALLHSLGFRVVQEQIPNYNKATQKLSDSFYTIVNDTVIESYHVEDIPTVQTTTYVPREITEEEKAQKHDNAIQALRAWRDELLKATDYTQLPDVIALNGPTLTTAYSTYRQQLRDMVTIYENDSSFIDAMSAEFPTKPGV